MSYIFHNFFYQPLFNVLIFLTAYLPGHSFGWAIVVMTLLVNCILLPFTHKMKHSQRTMQAIEPELRKIRQQFKDKKEEQARRTLELYKEHGVNPFSGFLLLFIQIPLFIALYRIFDVLATGAQINPSDFYSFTPPLVIPTTTFLYFFDLSHPSVALAFIAAVLQFIQGRLLTPKNIQGSPKQDSTAQIMQKQFQYTLPAVIFFIGLRFPAALALYWTVMSLFGIVHEGVVRHRAASLITGNGNSSGATKDSNT